MGNLVHGVCLAVLCFCHFIVMSLFLLNEINGDGEITPKQATDKHGKENTAKA